MKTILLTVFLFLTFTSTHILAARPSITSLQQQINQLQAELNSLQSEVDQQPRHPVVLDSNGKRIGEVLSIYRIGSDVNAGLLEAPSALFTINTDQGPDVNLIILSEGTPGFFGMSGSFLLFDQLNCQGNVVGIQEAKANLGTHPLIPIAALYTQYLETDAAEFVAYVPDLSVPIANVAYSSKGVGGWNRNEYNCSGFAPGVIKGYPVIKEVIDLSEEVATWVPPFRIEMAP